MKERLSLAILELQIENNGNATLENITQNWIDEKITEYVNKVVDDETTNEKKITMNKNDVEGKFIIDDNLNIKELENDEKIMFSIIKNFSGEGISIDNEATEIAYNEPYKATIILEGEYQLETLTVTMGEESIPVDLNTREINIEKVTGNIEITVKTVSDIITIDKAYMMDIHSTPYSSDTKLVKECLFDGITNYESLYGGVLFGSESSFIEITVYKNIKIYAYGQMYSDSGGATGNNILFKKYDGTSYTNYKECQTYTNSNRYELVTLEPGKYRVCIERRYVGFSEWEIEDN